MAYRAQENSLPTPTLDLSAITSSVIVPSTEPISRSGSPFVPQDDIDPWTLGSAASASKTNVVPSMNPIVAGIPPNTTGGAPTALTGGLGKDWWKKQAKVEVSVVPEKQGFILARYTAYLVVSDVGFNRVSHF